MGNKQPKALPNDFRKFHKYANEKELFYIANVIIKSGSSRRLRVCIERAILFQLQWEIVVTRDQKLDDIDTDNIPFDIKSIVISYWSYGRQTLMDYGVWYCTKVGQHGLKNKRFMRIWDDKILTCSNAKVIYQFPSSDDKYTESLSLKGASLSINGSNAPFSITIKKDDDGKKDRTIEENNLYEFQYLKELILTKMQQISFVHGPICKLSDTSERREKRYEVNIGNDVLMVRLEGNEDNIPEASQRIQKYGWDELVNANTTLIIETMEQIMSDLTVYVAQYIWKRRRRSKKNRKREWKINLATVMEENQY